MRTFTNPGPDEVHLTSLGVWLAPGETADVDIPKDVPCPAVLVEVTDGKPKSAKSDAKPEAK